MAVVERVVPAIPQIIGGGRILPSPAQFYLTGEDRLRITSANSGAGVALKVQCRTANIQGETVPHSFDHVPNSDRSTKTTEHALGTGSLLNATIFAGAGSPQMGQTFVTAQLIRGTGTAAIVLGTMLGGYVTRTQAIGFPGSAIVSSLEGEPSIRAITGSTPAVAAAIVETVPTGARWEVLSWAFTLTTGGFAADRKVYVQPTLSSGFYGVIVNFSTLPAASIGFFTFAPTMNSTSDPIEGLYQAGWGARVILTAGGQMITSARNLLAGDQFSAPSYIVREWLEVP